MNALLSGGGGDGGVVTDRRGEGRSFCEVSLFNKERIRHGQILPVSVFLTPCFQFFLLCVLPCFIDSTELGKLLLTDSSIIVLLPD